MKKSFLIQLVLLVIGVSIAVYFGYVIIAGPVYHGVIISNNSDGATVRTDYGNFVVHGASNCYVVGMHVLITSYPPINPSWILLSPTIMGSC